jgi:hypothetical protein
MSYCWIAPPEPPQPMVWATGPYDSMKCSLTIMAASAEMMVEQLLFSTLRVEDATAYPCARNRSCSTPPVAVPWWKPALQPPPNV